MSVPEPYDGWALARGIKRHQNDLAVHQTLLQNSEHSRQQNGVFPETVAEAMVAVIVET